MAHVFFEKLEKRRSTQSLYGGFGSSFSALMPKVPYKSPQPTNRVYYGVPAPDQRCQPYYGAPLPDQRFYPLYAVDPPRLLYGVNPPEMRTYYGVSIPPAIESSGNYPTGIWSSWTYPGGNSSPWLYPDGSGSSWNYPAGSESIWGISGFLAPLWNTAQTVFNWQSTALQPAPLAVNLSTAQLAGQGQLSLGFSLPTSSYSLPNFTHYLSPWNVQ